MSPEVEEVRRPVVTSVHIFLYAPGVGGERSSEARIPIRKALLQKTQFES